MNGIPAYITIIKKVSLKHKPNRCCELVHIVWKEDSFRDKIELNHKFF